MQPKGVLLLNKKYLIGKKGKTQNESEIICALIYRSPILVMSIFPKQWDRGIAINPPLSCRHLHVCFQSTYGIFVECFV